MKGYYGVALVGGERSGAERDGGERSGGVGGAFVRTMGVVCREGVVWWR